jgi:fructokinase
VAKGKKQVKWDVACFGELVMDMVPHSQVDGTWLYIPSPGGAPGNVAVGLAQLGRRTAMLSTVGHDGFGEIICTALQSYGVDISGVAQSAQEKTALSVVTHGSSGERDFIFYRDHPAEFAIDTDETKVDVIESAGISHFGVLPLAAERSAAAQKKAMNVAIDAGRFISFDPNFRPALWNDADVMLRAARDFISTSHIVKLSEGELFAMTGGHSTEDAARSLWHENLRIMAVTKGRNGAELFTGTDKLAFGGYKVEAIDTTAAGDAFMASLLSGLIDIDMDMKNHGGLTTLLQSACAAGALATTIRGAMASLPTKAAIQLFLTNQPSSQN